MTQEEKMLLIKDLSARLPYAVTVEHTSGFRGTLHDITVHHMYDDNDNVHDAICYTDFFGDEDSIYIEYFKPHLFPLSSMTEEQRCKLRNLLPNNCDVSFKNLKITFYDEGNIQLEQLEKAFNFLNLYHFDYRSLIEKGLAIDATGLDVY